MSTQTVTDRCGGYRARLDAHLATLPSVDARLSFCEREFVKWTERYEHFQREVAAGRYEGPATAWDYTITLCDLEHRRTLYGPVFRGVAP